MAINGDKQLRLPFVFGKGQELGGKEGIMDDKTETKKVELVFPRVMTKACQILAPFIIEFIGTFFLVLAVGFNSILQNPLAPFGIGCTLMVAIFLGGHISGAHYNPAVTLAVALTRREKISTWDAVIYIFIQVCASFVAGLFYWVITDQTFEIAPNPAYSEAKAWAVELFWTFLLASVVLQVATTETQAGNSFFGLAIGFTVVAGAITVGPISGGVFNPAVGTGPLLVHAIHEKSGTTLKYLWIYWCGPMLGGLLAGSLFWLTNRGEFHDGSAVEDGDEHLFAPEVKSIADVSAHKREGGKIIKHLVRRSVSIAPGRPTSIYDESEDPLLVNKDHHRQNSDA
jgi:aquaporin Z